MAHNTLSNRSIKIPDLHVRNPHAWYPPDVNLDPLDPLQAETEREEWGAEVSDPNYFATSVEEIEEEDTHYGAKLGSLAVGLDKAMDDNDEDLDVAPSDDEEEHEDIEGKYERR